MTWLEYITMILEWISLEISALPNNDFLRRVRTRAADFWRRTQRLALVIIIVPIIIFIAGIFFHSRPTIAIAGLLSTIFWGAILLAFASIAELLSVVYRELRGSETRGRIYIQAVATVLLGEMIVVGYAILVPVWNNPGAIPIVAMIAIILATMLVVWEMQLKVFRQIAFWVAIVAFVFFTASFFLPNTFSVIEKKAPKIDQYFAGAADERDTANDYIDKRKKMIENNYESEKAAIIEMLDRNWITAEEADRRMKNLINQRSEGLGQIQKLIEADNPSSTQIKNVFRKNILNVPLVLQIVFITAAAFLALGLIWNKFLKNRWLRTAALLAIGGTAIYFIIVVLQSNGITI